MLLYISYKIIYLYKIIYILYFIKLYIYLYKIIIISCNYLYKIIYFDMTVNEVRHIKNHIENYRSVIESLICYYDIFIDNSSRKYFSSCRHFLQTY